jgi:hypothetical protein
MPGVPGHPMYDERAWPPARLSWLTAVELCDALEALVGHHPDLRVPHRPPLRPLMPPPRRSFRPPRPEATGTPRACDRGERNMMGTGQSRAASYYLGVGVAFGDGTATLPSAPLVLTRLRGPVMKYYANKSRTILLVLRETLCLWKRLSGRSSVISGSTMNQPHLNALHPQTPDPCT